MAAVVGAVGRSIFYKLAGVSGVLAVALGAYGAHGPLLNKPGSEKYKEVGGLIFTGMTLFSGSCYLVALSQNRKLGLLAPFGGTLLMIGWASFLL